jgi:hypothetical protein
MKYLILAFTLFIHFNCNSPSNDEHSYGNRYYSSQEVIICLSNNAYAYHIYECQGLDRCTHEVETINQDVAQQKGYKPCKICY